MFNGQEKESLCYRSDMHVLGSTGNDCSKTGVVG